MCNCDSSGVVKAAPQDFPARVLSRLSGGGFLVQASNGQTYRVTDRSGRAAPGLTMTLNLTDQGPRLV